MNLLTLYQIAELWQIPLPENATPRQRHVRSEKILRLLTDIQELHPERQIIIQTEKHKRHLINISELSQAVPSLFDEHPKTKTKINDLSNLVQALKTHTAETRKELHRVKSRVKKLEISANIPNDPHQDP